MTADMERINRQRTYWHEKVRKQVDELLMLSIENNAQKYSAALDDLATSFIIVWRFDRKLDEAKEENE